MESSNDRNSYLENISKSPTSLKLVLPAWVWVGWAGINGSSSIYHEYPTTRLFFTWSPAVAGSRIGQLDAFHHRSSSSQLTHIARALPSLEFSFYKYFQVDNCSCSSRNLLPFSQLQKIYCNIYLELTQETLSIHRASVSWSGFLLAVPLRNWIAGIFEWLGAAAASESMPPTFYQLLCQPEILTWSVRNA